MSARAEGIRRIPAPSWTDEPQLRIAVALETLAGCTGWLDEYGQRQHDGDTCPVHESQDEGTNTCDSCGAVKPWVTPSGRCNECGDVFDRENDEGGSRLERLRDWSWRNFGL